MKKYDHQSLSDLIERASALGAVQITQMRWHWDISGSCQNGYERSLYAAPPARQGKYVDVRPGFTKHSLELRMTTRCRKCDPCRKHRAALWRSRALEETRKAHRTWFGTLTFRQERQDWYRAAAQVKASNQNLDFDFLDPGKQFRLIYNQISPALTKAIKRLRKNTGVKFKYLIVAEPHKSGAPHFHVLFHETTTYGQIRYDDLRFMWKEGFSQWKLVDDPRQASYLCKYLSKTLAARVRASQRYGSEQEHDHLIVIDYFENNRVVSTPKRKSIF